MVRLDMWLAALAMLSSGCSVQQFALNSLGDMLASGNGIFESDNDPVLIGEALPFSLKLIDSLLEQQPDHQGLLLAAARGYTFYGYAYVSWPAERLSRDDINAARVLRARARNLYLRAHGYASHALSIDYPNVTPLLREDPALAVRALDGRSERDLELLYWNAASLGLAISSARNEPALLARLPEVEAFLNRALELDEAWDAGATHEFALNIGPISGADAAELEAHYLRALELSSGLRASLFLAYADAVALPRQDRAMFTELIGKALALDIDAAPERRLLNVITQERADWLLLSIDELFLE